MSTPPLTSQVVQLSIAPNMPHTHHHHQPNGIVCALKPNPKFRRDGARALAKAIHRYGITEIEHGFIYSTGKPGHPLMRRTKAGTAAGASGETEVPTTDIQSDLEYVVDVKIGTPALSLALDFDTGSSDLWVWSTEYKASKSSTSGHAIYNPAKSSTAKKQTGSTWQISYGDGSSASGDVYTDAVTIGTVTIPDQAVEAASKLSASFLQGGSDGLLGLAWPSINTVRPTPAKTPVENMINENLIAQPLFTVKLTKGGADGFYTFGEIDTSVTSNPIKYTPVKNSNGFWEFPSLSWTMNSKTYTRTGTAIADTGTTLALVDDAMVQEIYAAIPGSKLDSTQGGYVYPSTATIPPLSFAVGENLFQLDATNFAYGDPDSDGFVFGGVQSVGNLGQCIFGDVFLKGVYVVFDQGNTRIGMAQRDD